MDLDRLAGGDVVDAVRVLLADLSQGAHLRRSHHAVLQLDAHHLVGATLALAVDAMDQAVGLEHLVGIDRTLMEQVDGVGEVGKLLLNRRRQAGGDGSRGGSGRHGGSNAARILPPSKQPEHAFRFPAGIAGVHGVGDWQFVAG